MLEHSGLFERRLRLLLSWRDKARQAVADGAGGAGSAEANLRTASALLETLKAGERTQLEMRTQGLRTALDTLGELAARAAQGGISPKRANRKAQKLQTAIDERRGELERCNQLLAAETPLQAGGLIDLPLEQYSAELQSLENPREQPAAPASAPRAARFEFSQSDRYMGALAVIAVLLAVFAFVIQSQFGGGSVAFSAHRVTTPIDGFELICTNGTQRPIALITTGAALGPQAGAPLDRYQLDTYLRQQGEDAFRLFPDTGAAWQYRGVPLSSSGPATVPPGVSATLHLDRVALERHAPGSAALRIVATRPNGRPRYSHTFDLAD